MSRHLRMLRTLQSQIGESWVSWVLLGMEKCNTSTCPMKNIFVFGCKTFWGVGSEHWTWLRIVTRLMLSPSPSLTGQPYLAQHHSNPAGDRPWEAGHVPLFTCESHLSLSLHSPIETTEQGHQIRNDWIRKQAEGEGPEKGRKKSSSVI